MSHIRDIRINNEILYLHYQCGYKLHKAMGRFQAHYDAPHEQFRGYFKRSTFDSWVKKFPLWSAPWVGTNVPGYTFREVGKFDDLSPEEKELLDIIKNQNMPETFYVVATNNSWSLLVHELKHAFWYLYPDYKEKATHHLNELPDLTYELNGLTEMGYKESSLLDEANAYSHEFELVNLFEDYCLDLSIDLAEILREAEMTG